VSRSPAPAGYRHRGNRLQRVLALDPVPDQRGRTVLLTGGTDGVGRALAEQLAAAGATVALTARDLAKGERVRTEISCATGNDDVHVVTLDLADLASVGMGARVVRDTTAHLDVLIANAGSQTHGPREETADGFERTFGVNHLGHALLVRELEPLLRASAPCRVVIVASEAHRRAKGGLDFADHQMARGRFHPTLQYNRSKLANVLYARELARRFAGAGIDVVAAHPGGVDTPMMQANFRNPVLHALYPAFAHTVLISPDDSAAGVLRVALDPALTGHTGDYYELGRPATPTATAQDDATSARLWAVTDDLLTRSTH
jgi:NAD(P)-dependent dehydrogenase (short-subunit alcohol dehydrogenase family)